MSQPSMAEVYGPFELPALGWRDDDPLLLPYDAIKATESAMYEGMSVTEFLTERRFPSLRLLSESEVRVIRRLYQEGVYSQQRLGDLFGVEGATISDVVRHKTYRWVA